MVHVSTGNSIAQKKQPIALQHGKLNKRNKNTLQSFHFQCFHSTIPDAASSDTVIADASSADARPRYLAVRDFFLARQPILNRNQDLIGYELLFRNAASGPANIIDDLSATAAVIAHTSHLGIEKVIGETIGFVNVDAAVLMSDIFQVLPREKVVLEIVETMKVTPGILLRIRELVNAGFRFALDDVVADSEDVQQLMPMMDIIKVDLCDMSLPSLLALTPKFKLSGKRLLAEKVETHAQFQTCLDLGFDYFQGYYFAKPVILTGKKLSPSQCAILELMRLIIADADNAAIEETIKRDVSLGWNLLRLVNTAGIGARHRIDSLSKALQVLGREQLRRWLQIMLYAEPNRKRSSMAPLLSMASSRGKLLELLTAAAHPGKQHLADTAFTVGIMSLMDTLFSLPMADILAEISVTDDVSNALLHRQGYFGTILSLAECLENMEENGAFLMPLLQQLHLSCERLFQLEIAAFEWSNGVVRSTASMNA